ncbi:hypothetical protein [Saccharothrix hoggarensis]|uniref:Uncharacterized protein n=1 Tax=Saccharothrix hoggarensis TaxID=913853 RepID=A0ABW3QDU9_9PSEU
MDDPDLPDLDLGHGVTARWTGWRPERDINPQYDGIPDVERFGLLVEHAAGDGSPCASFATFDGEVQRLVAPDSPKWDVVTLEPLTLSPSLLCRACGHHGFVRDGRWVPA